MESIQIKGGPSRRLCVGPNLQPPHHKLHEFLPTPEAEEAGESSQIIKEACGVVE